MAFNIEEFKSTVKSYLQPSAFELTINAPFKLVDLVNSLGIGDPQSLLSQLQLTCNASEVPGYNIDVIPIAPFVYGPSRMVPTSITFPPLQTTVYCDNEGKILKFFDAWQNLIISTYPIDTASNVSVNDPFEVSYLEDYATSIFLTLFSKSGVPVYRIEFIHAFPARMDKITLDWNLQNEIIQVPIQWHYLSYSVIDINN